MARDAKDRRWELAAADNRGFAADERGAALYRRGRAAAAAAVKRAATLVDRPLVGAPGRRTKTGRLRTASGEGWAVGRLLSGMTVASSIIGILRVAR
jgi:hypothetical protein